MTTKLTIVPPQTPEALTLDERFDSFKKANPEFYDAFKRHVFELLSAGNRRYPASEVLPVVRFNSALLEAGGGVRADNELAAPMARQFNSEHPELVSFLSFSDDCMTRVVVESPFAGKTPKERADNVAYARRALRDCLLRGEAPFASHLLYTQASVLDDDVPGERDRGIRAGFAFRAACDKTVVYKDHGISDGMEWGIRHAEELGHPIEYRSLEVSP